LHNSVEKGKRLIEPNFEKLEELEYAVQKPCWVLARPTQHGLKDLDSYEYTTERNDWHDLLKVTKLYCVQMGSRAAMTFL
jgi:hypothetical protein